MGSHPSLGPVAHTPSTHEPPPEQVPQLPPQPSGPHSRPLHEGTQEATRGPQSPQSVPSSQTDVIEPAAPSSHSPSKAKGHVSVQRVVVGVPESEPGPPGPLGDRGPQPDEAMSDAREIETREANEVART